jgi:hypothetical protein
MPDVVYDAVLGSNPLKQITSSEFGPGVNILKGRMSGNPIVFSNYVQSYAPESSLTTVDIAGFHTAFGTQGAVISDGSTVLIPYQKRANGATFAGGSSNAVIAGVSNCPIVLMPESIAAPRQGAVTATGKLCYLSIDGLVTPFTELVNQALASQAFNAMYSLGPVFINGTLVSNQVGFNVNYGLGWSEREHYEGTPSPTRVFLDTVDPMIDVQCEDFDQMASILAGATISSVTAYLRKRSPRMPRRCTSNFRLRFPVVTRPGTRGSQLRSGCRPRTRSMARLGSSCTARY